MFVSLSQITIKCTCTLLTNTCFQGLAQVAKVFSLLLGSCKSHKISKNTTFVMELNTFQKSSAVLACTFDLDNQQLEIPNITICI